MLFRILSYWGGYLTITLPEECLEKFINLAVSRGIILWDINGIGTGLVAMKVRLNSVQALRHVARMTGCRFKIIERLGLPFFLSRMRRRRAMTAGALVFVALLYLLSSFIWFIEVTGNNRVSDQVVEQVARQAGLKLGTPRWNLDIPVLEEAILNQVPGLSWVGVYVDGTRVYIKVVEKKLPPPDETGHPVDLVAARNGVITEMLVFSGYPQVGEGSMVTSGQVLISAAQIGENRYIGARGIVKARVRYEALAGVRMVEKGAEITGRETTRFGIKIGSKEIILMGPRKIPFEHYAKHVESKRAPGWRNINIPVELLTVKYCEEKPYINNYTEDEARRLACQKALATVRRQLPGGTTVVNESLEELAAPEPGTVRVKAMVETLEDIGLDRPRL